MIHELVANKKRPYRPIERYGVGNRWHRHLKFSIGKR
jgi:hypothetical protein